MVPESLQGNRSSARGLERVVPIAQRQTIGEVVVALASLELFGEGLGVLRYGVSCKGVCSKVATAYRSRSSSSGIDPAANCHGRLGAAIAARAKRTARWRCVTCQRPGSWRSR
jgi:hypothetical protein